MLIQVRLVIGLRFRTEMSGPWGMTVETSCPDSLTIEWVGNRLASDRIRPHSSRSAPPPLFFWQVCFDAMPNLPYCCGVDLPEADHEFPQGGNPNPSREESSADSRPVSRFPSSRIAISKNSSHRCCSSLTKVRSAVFYPKPTCFPYLKPS